MPPPDYAHTRAEEPEETWEPLALHLARVARLARRFAAAFDAGEWGKLAGLWHDLGKYHPAFQERLRGSRKHVDHAIGGAGLAAARNGMPLAFVVAGHHAGLANSTRATEDGPRPLRARLREHQAALGEVLARVPACLIKHEIPALPAHLAGGTHGQREQLARRGEFWTRFLFSALVDADYLATEAFYDRGRSTRRGGYDSIPQLRRRLDAALDAIVPRSPVDHVRARVLADCRAAAVKRPGLFSLTVPTGGGKTLSSMAFALAHAERHGLRRVIVVIPYTSIIEQNAAVYRGALGADNVIEHHSAIDPIRASEEDGEHETRRRLAAENWDAPVVVTTAVQFFESLFANRPSRCRKLHNVARSVIVLDEAQTLPVDFLAAVLDALQELTDAFGCTVVLSTATQPALARRTMLPYGLQGVEEIVGDVSGTFAALDRVRVQWPEPGGGATPYEKIAEQIEDLKQVLAVVHLRDDARTLAELVREDDRFHLSALMCAAHRADVLAKVRRRLELGLPCRLVSTQLVEAGVDVDFPVVFRAMAGLDSLAQAAGRCNRNGRLPSGDFIVFRAETLPPRGNLCRGFDVAEALLRERGERLSFLDPDIQETYFRTFYLGSDLDKRGVQAERGSLNFAEVARRFRMIDDGYSTPVVVPWGDSRARVSAYAARPDRDTQRALQPFMVQVHERHVAALTAAGALEVLHGAVHVLTVQYAHLYDPAFGLRVWDPGQPDPAGLHV